MSYNPVEIIQVKCATCGKIAKAKVSYKYQKDSNLSEDLYTRDRMNVIENCDCKNITEQLKEKFLKTEYSKTIIH